MTNNTPWKNEHYLPLLSERHVLMLVEILNLSKTYPNLLIYRSSKREVRAQQFKSDIEYKFTLETFDDIVECLKPHSSILVELNKWKETQQPLESVNDLYLLMAIRLHCGLTSPDLFHILDTLITWNNIQLWHWRFFFAKLLILL